MVYFQLRPMWLTNTIWPINISQQRLTSRMWLNQKWHRSSNGIQEGATRMAQSLLSLSVLSANCGTCTCMYCTWVSIIIYRATVQIEPLVVHCAPSSRYRAIMPIEPLWNLTQNVPQNGIFGSET